MKAIKTKSYNFLLEMLVVIILFTFCCVIFVELFALSSKKNNDANIMALALNDVETYASLIKNGQKLSEEYINDDYKINITKLDVGYNIKAINNNDEVIISIDVASLGDTYEE